nr:type II secretion system protein [Kiritimatiella glycovorans]
MTLIELVVVLALMAGLASMMLVGASDLANRGRYDETVTRMRLIREAVVGNGVEAGRFVRDMGRLPNSLGELVTSTNTFQHLSYSFDVPGYAPITAGLHAGWAGPYVVASDTNFYDGFGEPIELINGTQLVARVKDRAGWLTNDVEYSFASVSNCWLRVEVRALHRNPRLALCAWMSPNTNAPSLWSSTTNYFPGDLCSTNADVYVCMSTNSNEPPSVTGTNWYALPQHEFLTAGNVLLAVPNTTGPLSKSLTAGTPVVFSNLFPGIRQVFAYGFNAGGGTTNNAWHSGAQSVEIRPGANFITLYLAEQLQREP